MKRKYDINALKANVKRCDDNIVLFTEAIEKEKNTKEELLTLIEELEDDI